ncbi:MAG: hypothetical protein Q4G03_02135 [Planctomycetia bacterium]|nr:hypothetical protein [Planctomycetia bacterium]
MDRTPYQDKIIQRYYENRPELMRQKIAELITDIYLATTDKKRAQLWRRVELALKNLNVEQKKIDALLEKADPVVLAQFLEKELGGY